MSVRDDPLETDGKRLASAAPDSPGKPPTVN